MSGPVRPRTEVLAEVEAYLAGVRPRVEPVLAQFLLPDPTKLFRWKVALTCGHNTETLTHGRDDFPDQRRHQDPLTRTPLNAGEMICHDDSHAADPKPYQDIVEWISSTVTEFDADPVEPKDGYEPQLWPRSVTTSRTARGSGGYAWPAVTTTTTS